MPAAKPPPPRKPEGPVRAAKQPPPTKVKPVEITRAPVPAPPEESKSSMSLSVSMTPDEAITSFLIARDSREPVMDLETTSNTVNLFDRFVKAVAAGEDIEPYKVEVGRIAANQPEKMEIYNSLLNQINIERIADAAVTRANVEKALKRASARPDVNAPEAVVVYKIVDKIVEEGHAKLTKNSRAVDTLTVTEKIDVKNQQVERSVMQQWEGTTPQGREIIRKKLFALRRDIREQKPVVDVASSS